MFFELTPQSEFKVETGGIGGNEDGGSIEDHNSGPLLGIQAFASTRVEYVNQNEKKYITYEYDVGFNDTSNFDVVKKGFNYFELTYTFTDSILNLGTVCE